MRYRLIPESFCSRHIRFCCETANILCVLACRRRRRLGLSAALEPSSPYAAGMPSSLHDSSVLRSPSGEEHLAAVEREASQLQNTALQQLQPYRH